MKHPFSTALRSLAACAGVGVLTFFSIEILPVNATTAGFFYLILILAVATFWGFLESATASAVAMLCYNYYFLPPVGRFTIADPQNWVALFTFLLTALVASHLSDRAKRQNLEAKRRQQETEQLYALSRAILMTDATQSIGAQAAQHIAQIFEAASVVLFDSKASQFFHGGQTEIAGAEAVLKQSVLQGTPQLGEFDAWPILLGGQAIGALAISGVRMSDSAVQALLNLVAIALERVRMEEAANKAEVARQSEEFKSMLLDAIAHEFKTPLTSIKVAASTMLSDSANLPPDQRELAAIVDEETDRLSLLVTEAVRMSQIDAGKVKLERSATAPHALLRAAAASFSGRGDDRIRQPEGIESVPDVLVDPDLITMALRQLIDNGLKYSPAMAKISLGAEQAGDRVLIRISDQGPGIPERDRERIFDKFFRRSNVRDKVPGSGLGLHIAREIVRAHGGDLWVESGPDGGAQFCVALPAMGKAA